MVNLNSIDETRNPSLDEQVDSYIRIIIEEELRNRYGDVSSVAKKLKVSRSKMYRLMNRLEISLGFGRSS